MARLVGKSGDHKGQIFELPAEIQTIGRGKSCDIQLRDTSVSRTHASIRRAGERFILKDEGSSYGTYIDGNPIIESDLRSGQEVRIGQTVFDFLDGGADGRVPLPEPPDASLEYTVMHAIGDADAEDERDSTGVVRIKQRLAIALEVSGFLNSALDLGDLFGRLLDKTIAVLRARSAMILLRNEKTGALDVAQSRGVSTGPEANYSRTIVDRVVASGESLLVSDARSGEEMQISDSIYRLGIRSAMCVPLRHESGIVGALNVEAPGTGVFSANDLRMLMILGNIAGTAIVNSRLREEKVRSERLAAIGQSMAGLAHDIKNILSGIKAGGYLVDDAISRSDMTTMAAGWDLVKVSQDRIHQLMLNMLDYSKEREPKYETVNLEDLMTEVKNLVVLRGVDYGVGVKVEVHPRSREVEAEGVSIHRCLLNLAGNAVDAMEDRQDGKILLRTRPDAHDERRILIDVIDNGPGIPAEILPTLFQAFTSTKGAKGTGLGLAVSHKIAREHRGEITVKSSPGQGTMFTISLPRKRPMGPAEKT